MKGPDIMSSHKIRIEKIERFLQPAIRLEIEEITVTRPVDEEKTEVIEVPYLKLSPLDRHGNPIASFYLPKNGREAPS